MANPNYTGSPLGIIHSEKIEYSDNGNVISSIFSSTTQMNKTESGTFKIEKSGRNFISQHKDEINDISTSNIIERLKDIPALSLKYSDFAYLKNYGVYPNNRLVCVRRFETPVPDNLFAVQDFKQPMSTIIGYAEDIGSLVKINVSESWEPSDATLTELLNEFGNDVMGAVFKDKAGGGFGDLVSQGVNMIPMGNLTTILQRKILSDPNIGIIDKEDASILPIADPNIIRESQQRKMVDEKNEGTGLIGKFNITLTTEYEQKFINGVDPTIVYMDIINNALSMGTSRSTFFLGRSDDKANKGREIIERFSKNPTGELLIWIKAIIDSMQASLKELGEFLTGGIKKKDESGDDAEEKREKQEAAAEESGNKLIADVVGLVTTIADSILNNIIQKYRHKLMGVITNMTGAPSTPWHVTIGNPLKPIFISGDMLCTSVNIEPGNVLAFNNLPNTIKVTITLVSARNLGLQEIIGKYNGGEIRTTNGVYISEGPKDFWGDPKYVYNKPTTKPIEKKTPKESSQSPELDQNNPNTTTQTTKATTNGTQKVNNDANGEAVIPATENTGGISNADTTEIIKPETIGKDAIVIEGVEKKRII